MLPQINGANLTGNESYFTGLNGLGASYQPGDVIISNATLYAYDNNGGCFDEEILNIIINTGALDLGNDTLICAGESVLFDAGAGFDSYLWQDGSTLQTFSASSAGTFWCQVELLGSNQIQNGDFELGDNLFSSSYTNGTGGGWGALSNPGTYEVSINPQLEHVNFMSCGDHSTGTGQMMVVNGASTAGANVWCQDITVVPGTNYQFLTWISNALNDPNVAQLQFTIDGIPLGGVFSTSSIGCLWQDFNAVWNFY